MRRTQMGAAALFLALAGSVTADEEQAKRVKLDEARARSVVTGKPILVFAMTDLIVDGPPTKGLDRAFATEAVRSQKDDFLFVKCTDMTTVKAVRATSKSEVIFLDPDGDEILRTVVKSPAEIAAAMRDTLTRDAHKPIPWVANAPPTDAGVSEGKHMVVLLFGSDSDDALAAVRSLEDRPCGV